MIPGENKSETRSDGVNVGTLIITGFTGSPQLLLESILKSEHVDTATIYRSGIQFELTVSLSHPLVTSSRLFELVDIPGYDAKIQGVQMIPRPTVVVALSPARTGRRRFPRPVTPQLIRQTFVPDARRRPTPTAAADSHKQPAAIAGIEPGSDTFRQLRLTASYIEKIARILAKSITYAVPIVGSFIGLGLTVSVTFVHRNSVQFWILTKRTARGIIVFGPMFLGYISIVIDMVVDYLFGSGTDDEQKSPPSKSAGPENNRGRLK